MSVELVHSGITKPVQRIDRDRPVDRGTIFGRSHRLIRKNAGWNADPDVSLTNMVKSVRSMYVTFTTNLSRVVLFLPLFLLKARYDDGTVTAFTSHKICQQSKWKEENASPFPHNCYNCGMRGRKRNNCRKPVKYNGNYRGDHHSRNNYSGQRFHGSQHDGVAAFRYNHTTVLDINCCTTLFTLVIQSVCASSEVALAPWRSCGAVLLRVCVATGMFLHRNGHFQISTVADRLSMFATCGRIPWEAPTTERSSNQDGEMQREVPIIRKRPQVKEGKPIYMYIHIYIWVDHWQFWH
jgi:hypothetical protein